MEFIAKYVLITFIFVVFRASHEVQGKTEENVLEPEGNQLEDEPQQVIFNNKETVNLLEENALKSEQLLTAKKPATQSVKTEPNDTEENSLTDAYFNRLIEYFNFTQTKQEKFSHENHAGANKSCDTEISLEKKKNFLIKPPAPKSLSNQRIFCRQTIKTEFDDQGKIIETIQQKCTPRPALPLFKKDKNCRTMVTSTPKGINCRRVMNSEFNELGEIVDSVTEICDPPPTTTTTTRKPILYNWPRTTTTTPKPWVKVCRPVMDSYLNDEGIIIDSVSMNCKMEQVN